MGDGIYIKIDSNYPIYTLLEFCSHATNDSRNGAVNMDPVDWENKPHTFLYLLYKEKRFDGPNNGYIVYQEKGKILCGQGYYLSDIDNMICCGVRSYTIPGANCSLKHADIKDIVFAKSKEKELMGCFYSMNEYNKSYVDGYVRINDPKNFSTSYMDETGQWWSKNGRKIHPFKPYGPISLKGT